MRPSARCLLSLGLAETRRGTACHAGPTSPGELHRAWVGTANTNPTPGPSPTSTFSQLVF